MDSNEFSFTFPLQKVDKQRRIVTGIATANNIDLVGEIIDFDASVRAFSQWIGNIREMHDKTKAVGSLVDWRTTKVIYQGDVYDAIEVDVYISKAAEDTWQKILDKTLKGFSIGALPIQKERVYDEETGRYATKYTEYLLGELSVVDNPCNPTGLFSLIKRAEDGTLVSAVVEKQAVFYCSDHKYATINDNKFCPVCAKEMEVIGQVDELNADVVNKMISDFEIEKGGTSNIMDLQENDKNDIVNDMNEFTDDQKDTILSKLSKVLFGGVDNAPAVAVPNITVNITKDLVSSLDDKSIEEEEIKNDDTASNEETVEKSVGASEEAETMEEEMNIEEITKALGSLLDEKLEKVKADISAEVDEKIGSIEKSVGEFKESTEEALSKTTEEVEKIATTGAIQKSVDTEDEETDIVEKSVKTEAPFWGNIFVPGEFVEALGYDS